MKIYRFIISIIIFSLIFISCATNKVSLGQPKKIYLKIFDNQTVQYSLHTSLNEYLKDELLRESNISILPENEAEYVISGEIFNYELKPMSYDMDNHVESYEQIIEAKVHILDKVSNKIVLDDTFSENEIYFTIYGNSFETKSDTTLEKEAQEKILYFMARNISRKIVYADLKNGIIEQKNEESNKNNINNKFIEKESSLKTL